MSGKGICSAVVTSGWEFMAGVCLKNQHFLSEIRWKEHKEPMFLFITCLWLWCHSLDVCHFMAATCHFSTFKISRVGVVTMWWSPVEAQMSPGESPVERKEKKNWPVWGVEGVESPGDKMGKPMWYKTAFLSLLKHRCVQMMLKGSTMVWRKRGTRGQRIL